MFMKTNKQTQKWSDHRDCQKYNPLGAYCCSDCLKIHDEIGGCWPHVQAQIWRYMARLYITAGISGLQTGRKIFYYTINFDKHNDLANYFRFH
jgi:hypothetical protein